MNFGEHSWNVHIIRATVSTRSHRVNSLRVTTTYQARASTSARSLGIIAQFSRGSIEAHWASGIEDATAALKDPAWLRRGIPERGSVTILDHAGSHAAKDGKKGKR